jgi:hypothetical protein
MVVEVRSVGRRQSGIRVEIREETESGIAIMGISGRSPRASRMAFSRERARKMRDSTVPIGTSVI